MNPIQVSLSRRRDGTKMNDLGYPIPVIKMFQELVAGILLYKIDGLLPQCSLKMCSNKSLMSSQYDHLSQPFTHYNT